MILSLLTTFLTACSSYHLYGSVRNYNQTANNDFDFTITGFDYYQSQTDLDNINISNNSYNSTYYYKQTAFNGFNQEYLLFHNAFVVTDEVNQEFGTFILYGRIPDEVLATYDELTEYNDEVLFDLGLSFMDEDFNNASVIDFSPNIKNFLTNVDINVNFNFFRLYDNEVLERVEYCNYTLDIPLYVQNYGGEVFYNLGGDLNDLISQTWATQGGSLVCAVSVTYTMVDMHVVQEYWYNQGYYQGKEDGYALGGGNDFQKILGTIIDTPILYLRKFFGYEVFGVNLYGAIATIMSLIVALAVFRMIRSFI